MNSSTTQAREVLIRAYLEALDAGHYPWEDAADEYAALVTAWWQGGCANLGE